MAGVAQELEFVAVEAVAAVGEQVDERDGGGDASRIGQWLRLGDRTVRDFSWSRWRAFRLRRLILCLFEGYGPRYEPVPQLLCWIKGTITEAIPAEVAA